MRLVRGRSDQLVDLAFGAVGNELRLRTRSDCASLRVAPPRACDVCLCNRAAELGVKEIDEDTFTETMSVIVKHRTDMDIVSERVGVKLGPPAPPAQPAVGSPAADAA